MRLESDENYPKAKAVPPRERIEHCLGVLEGLQPDLDAVPGRLTWGELYWALKGGEEALEKLGP